MLFDDDPGSGVIPVPWEQLSSEALSGVLEEFVTREGTDYGDTEFSLDDKKQHVLNQLKNGQAALLFDPDVGTCHIQLTDTIRRQGF